MFSKSTILKASLSMIALMSSHAFAGACQNQELACRIASTTAELVGDAQAAGHWALRGAAVQQYAVADAFCNCDFTIYTPGTGILQSRYNMVKFRFGQMGGAPAASQPEINRMLDLRKEFGF